MASIEGVKRKNHSDGYRVRYRDDLGRPQRSPVFDRKADALAFKKNVEADVLRGEYIDPRLGRTGFREWTESWIAGRVSIKKSTRARYQAVLDGHLVPYFGDLQLNEITPVEVQVWLAALQRAHAPSAVRRYYIQLASIMKDAVKAGLIPKTPCVATAPKAKKSEMRFLSVAEVDSLADAITPMYQTMVYVAAYAGPRWGELIGLRRRHIDTLRGFIRIEEQITETDGQLDEGQTLKSDAGRRTVSIPPFLVKMLEKHFLELETRRADAGLPPLSRDDYVFVSRDFTPLRRGGFRSNHWLPALKAAKLGHLRVYDLRHTAVSFAINLSHAHPKAVQVRFGHSSIQQTYDTYGHLFPQMDGLISEALERAYAARTVAEEVDNVRGLAG